MTPLPLSIAFAHLWARKRQTGVSIGGVMLGVAIFVGIGGMMNGFHHYFLSQLVDTNPHIVMSDEIRQAAAQPLTTLHPDGAVEIHRVLPRDPVRGIAGAAAIVGALNAMDGVAAAPSLIGQSCGVRSNWQLAKRNLRRCARFPSRERNRRPGSSERGCCWPTGKTRRFLRWGEPWAHTIKPSSVVSGGRWPTV
jgi:hypothetical protein